MGRVQRRENSGTTSATPTKEEGTTTTTTKQRQHQQEDHHRDRRVKAGVSSLDKNIVENVLNTRNVQDLREHLEEIKYTKEFITLERFGEVCRKEVWMYREETGGVRGRYENAGLVIQIEDYVYLEPREYNEGCHKRLTGRPFSNLRSFGHGVEKIERGVRSNARKSCFSGEKSPEESESIVIRWIGRFKCASWPCLSGLRAEFSWDVMEPISYFVGLANVIMGYIYFMFTQRDFSFGTWQSQMMQNAMDRQLKTGKFDVDKCEQIRARKDSGEGTWFGNTRVILFWKRE